MDQTSNAGQNSNKPIILISCGIEGTEAAEKIKDYCREDFEFIIETQTTPNQAPPSHESFFDTTKIEAVINIYSYHWKENASVNYKNYCNKNNSPNTILYYSILKAEDKDDAKQKFNVVTEPFNLSIPQHLVLLKAALSKLQKKSAFVKRTIHEYVDKNVTSLQIQRVKKFRESIIYSLFGTAFILIYAIGVLYYDDRFLQKNISILNWYFIWFNGIKLAAVLTALAILVRHCFITARMLNIERIKLYDKEHAINYGKMFIDIFDSKLADEDISKQDIHNAFKNWNIERSGEKSVKTDSSEDRLHSVLQDIANFLAAYHKP